ncbi:MAG: adenine deaminase [Marinilabiliales bacterium]
MKIIGNIIDIHNKEIYLGEIEFAKTINSINKIGHEDKKHDYIAPGLVNSHVHIESTMLSPADYAKTVVKYGSVASVCDPHEIANVLGVYGIDYMIENGKSTPYKFYFGAPSCVPATEFETSGFNLNAEVIKSLLKNDDIYFLAEMMNYPGVINRDKDIIEKVNAGKFFNKLVDGHIPGVKGEDLKKYIEAGITTDHECFTLEEALEKINYGMKIQIREGSAAKNFNQLYSLIDTHPGKVMLCTDDSHPDDLLNGHMDVIIRKGLEKKCDLFNLLYAAVEVPRKHYNLNVGTLRKEEPADFIIINNPVDFKVLATYIDGNSVYENGTTKIANHRLVTINNFARKELCVDDIIVNSNKKIPVIKILDGELITEKIYEKIKIENSNYVSDVDKDILKMVVASRYDNSKPAVGFVKNFGLKKGAIASSIAHDSHNIIAVGTSDEMIIKAINEIINMKGGITACDENEKLSLQLEIAGLMTNSSVENVAEIYKKIENKAKSMGSELHAPFMTLSFMSLLVIPELKLSDKGLFDVTKFKFI